MRLRSLSVAVLTAVVLVPVGGVSASYAADTTDTVRAAALGGSTWKNSATKRRPLGRVAAAPTAAVAPTAPRATTTPTTTPSYADQVLALTNVERTSRGLRPLAFSPCADKYADSWAGRLAAAGSLSHQALSPILSGCSARGVGENVAFGNVTPAALVRMWMDSAGHRANILNASFTHLGVGNVTTGTGRTYGVQVFLTA